MCELHNVTNVEHRDVYFLASMQFSEKLTGYEKIHTRHFPQENRTTLKLVP